jgi:AraC family transcriptional regulator, regulatory protein of adaptative response / methylphosphotriester-DNA alkyltransferase methyltransferase
MTARPQQITQQYLNDLDKHLLDIIEARTTEMLELKDFAEMQHIHPIHFSNTIKEATGLHPCYFYEEKIMNIAKSLLEKNKMTIGAIAELLTYDPSNFTKFFKRFGKITPKQYREDFLKKQ